MRRLIAIAVVVVLGLGGALGSALVLLRSSPPNLPRAKSVTIIYSVGQPQPMQPNRRLVVPQHENLLSLLDLQSTRKNIASSSAPWGWLEFELPDGSRFRCGIDDDDHAKLHLWNWGQLCLKTSRFYDEVNALVSAHEGRPIDVLKDN